MSVAAGEYPLPEQEQLPKGSLRYKLLALVLASALIILALSGCGGDEKEKATMTPPSTPTVALTPAVYTEPLQPITVDINEQFNIELHITLRLGADWKERHDEDMLALVDNAYIDDDPSQPGLGGTRRFTFKALRAGDTQIVVTRTHSDRALEERVFAVQIYIEYANLTLCHVHLTTDELFCSPIC